MTERLPAPAPRETATDRGSDGGGPVRCDGCGAVAEPVIDGSTDDKARGAYYRGCNATWVLPGARAVWGAP
jgi:hypothetical protein